MVVPDPANKNPGVGPGMPSTDRFEAGALGWDSTFFASSFKGIAVSIESLNRVKFLMGFHPMQLVLTSEAFLLSMHPWRRPVCVFVVAFVHENWSLIILIPFACCLVSANANLQPICKRWTNWSILGTNYISNLFRRQPEDALQAMSVPKNGQG